MEKELLVASKPVSCHWFAGAVYFPDIEDACNLSLIVVLLLDTNVIYLNYNFVHIVCFVNGNITNEIKVSFM